MDATKLRPILRSINARLENVQWIDINDINELFESQELGWNNKHNVYFMYDENNKSKSADNKPLTKSEFEEIENKAPWSIYYNDEDGVVEAPEKSESQSGNKDSDTRNNKPKIKVSDLNQVDDLLTKQFNELEEKEKNTPEGHLFDRYQNKYITFEAAKEGAFILLKALEKMGDFNGDFNAFIRWSSLMIQSNSYNDNQSNFVLTLIRLIGEFEGKAYIWYGSVANYLQTLNNGFNNALKKGNKK